MSKNDKCPWCGAKVRWVAPDPYHDIRWECGSGRQAEHTWQSQRCRIAELETQVDRLTVELKREMDRVDGLKLGEAHQGLRADEAEAKNVRLQRVMHLANVLIDAKACDVDGLRLVEFPGQKGEDARKLEDALAELKRET